MKIKESTRSFHGQWCPDTQHVVIVFASDEHVVAVITRDFILLHCIGDTQHFFAYSIIQFDCGRIELETNTFVNGDVDSETRQLKESTL